MKKKLLTVFLALGLVMTLSAPALAADGVEVTDPHSKDREQEAVVTYDETLGFQAENDEDAVIKADETTADGTDITVFASVTESMDICYKLDIAWGTMTYRYSGGVGGWDPVNHVYTADSTPGWVTENMVDGVNNKITITNHSNRQVGVDLEYLTNGKLFNDSPGYADAVTGNFFADNDKALAASAILTDTLNIPDALMSSVNLDSAAPTGGEERGAPHSVDVFFAFSGKPDAGKTLSTFTDVGTITVYFVP